MIMILNIKQKQLSFSFLFFFWQVKNSEMLLTGQVNLTPIPTSQVWQLLRTRQTEKKHLKQERSGDDSIAGQQRNTRENNKCVMMSRFD